MRVEAISFAAGLLAPFTVGLVGEEPIGELILVAVAGWALLCLALNRAWPSRLFRSRFFGWAMAAQLIALCAYVASDLYRGSSPHDALRGWSRMVFLGLDLVAVAYLFGRSARSFVLLEAGLCLGSVLQALIQGPLFGDYWKFGYGTPLSYLGIYLAGFGGPLLAALAGGALGAANFLKDYRSEAGLCLLTAVFSLTQWGSRRIRLILAPLAVAAAAAALLIGRSETGVSERADRSNIERSSMMEAAGEAFLASPLIGHGSWFSNTRVYDRFILLWATRAREAHVGGYFRVNSEPEDTSFHSQILVALAEGGIFGAAFFLLYAGGLAWGLGRLVFARKWDRLSPFLLLFLLGAAWNLIFSPFSGAHRIGIAQACGLVLLLLAERAAERTPPELLAS